MTKNRVLFVSVFLLFTLFDSVVAARADIVPWLTGTFPGSSIVAYQLGTGLNVGGGELSIALPDGSFGFIDTQFLSTSSNFVETPIGCPDQGDCSCQDDICGWVFGGTLNGGSLLMTVFDANNNHLIDFTGRIMSGSFGGQYCFFNEACGDLYARDDINFSFTGIWSNGWHSLGEYDIDCGTYGCVPGNSAIEMVTTTPEIPSIVLFGSGALGLASAIRLKMVR